MLARTGALGALAQVYASPGQPHAAGLHARNRVHHGEAPAPEELDQFVPWTRAALERGVIERVVPSSDNVVFALAQLRDLLPPTQQRMTPTADEALDFLFKDRFHQRCTALGIPVPETWYPGSVEEAGHVADALPYPIVMKPRAHVGVGMAERGLVIWSAAELRQRFRPYAGIEGARALMAAHPALQWPMLQRYLPPPDWRNVSVCGFRHPDGEVLAAMAVEKAGQWPPGTGVGTAFRVLDDPSLVQAGLRLVQAFGASGIFEIEFQRQGEDRRAIDFNLRSFGMINLPIACGLDLPQLWWRTLEGERPAPMHARRTDLIWRERIAWHAAMMVSVLRGPDRVSRLRHYGRHLAQPSVGPIPADAGWRMLLQHRLNALRRLRHQVPNYFRAPRASLMEYWS